MTVIDVLKGERERLAGFALPHSIIFFRNTLRFRFLARGNFRVRFLANQFIRFAGSRNQKPHLQFDRRVAHRALFHRGDEIEDVAADATARLDA